MANALHCNIDSLLGYAAEQQKITDYEERYKVDGYYWGIQPSNMCYEIMKLCPPVKPLRLLDVACGEGKNAVFFARNGYNVSGFDAANSGLEKARQLADQMQAEVKFFQANMLDFRLEGTFDIIYVPMTLVYADSSHQIIHDRILARGETEDCWCMRHIDLCLKQQRDFENVIRIDSYGKSVSELAEEMEDAISR